MGAHVTADNPEKENAMPRIARSLALVVPVALLLGLASAAPGAQISADLHGSSVSGSGFSSGTGVQVVLKDPLGAVKGVANETIADGGWWLSFGSTPAPVTIGAGDALTVLVDGSAIGTMGVPGIVVDTNAAKDLTTGRVTAAPGGALPAAVELDLYLAHLTATPGPTRDEVWTDATVPVAADGRFSMAWGTASTPRDVRRNDEITVYARLVDAGLNQWSFRLPAPVTGVSVFTGINAIDVGGPVNGTYTLELATASGLVKARTVATLFDAGGGTGYFTKAGRQVAIPAGLFVRLKGVGGYRVKVPSLAGAVDAAADRVAGATLPGVVVEGSLTHDQYDAPARVYAVSDGLGAFELTFGEDVVPGDLVELRIQLADGTWIVRRLPVAP